MGKLRNCGSSANWEKDSLMIFCGLCLNEVAAGNRPTTHFNKEGWTNLVKNFEAQTGRRYDRTQLKNKWDLLKKDWKIWKELKRGATGLGWDPRKKTIDASDEWWSEKIQVQPNAKKFRYCGIDPELEDNLDRMFGGVVATGGHVWSASQNVEHGTPSQRESLNERNDDPPPNVEENIESSYSNRLNYLKGKGGVKKKKGASFLREQISQLVDACVNMPTEETTKTVQPSLSEAIKTLEQIEEVYQDVSLYIFSTQLLEDVNKREIFMSMASERRTQYLRFFFEKNK